MTTSPVHTRAPLIAFAVVGGVGLVLAGLSHPANTGDRVPHHHGGASQDASTTVTGTEGHAGHDHSRLMNVPAASAPSVAISVKPDSMAGWNLHIETTGFRFAPEDANSVPVVGEGHAHLYVNGTKLARIYGHWFHIPALPAGENDLLVTLNANDHSTLAVDGTPIAAYATVIAGQE
ncbi:hypothetical protein [Acuticoccus yangtzensis]|uniref:hypothetical protein n=1 Tax=Acuticoccus yangtzensis TaxID=1443441 RepID=UPI0009499162|nr:hypothetical protein [Acuticoccus yangtzensis]